MARTCTICAHDHHDEINKALTGGASLTSTAKAFGVGRSALDRHRRGCASRRLVAELVSSAQQVWALQPVAPSTAPALASLPALAELRATAMQSRMTPSEHTAMSGYLLEQAAAVALARGDAPTLARVARERTRLALVEQELATKGNALPTPVDNTLLMLTAVCGSDDDAAWAENELAERGYRHDA